MEAILGLSGHPSSHFYFIQGKVEDSIPRSAAFGEFVALQNCTVAPRYGLNKSTITEINFLYDRLVPRGLPFVDAFCTWSGSAIVDFFGSTEEIQKLAIDGGMDAKLCLALRKPQ